MSKIWRVILLIVLVSVLLGSVCVGVGIITGADVERIYTVLNNQFGLEAIENFVTQFIMNLQNSGIL